MRTGFILKTGCCAAALLLSAAGLRAGAPPSFPETIMYQGTLRKAGALVDGVEQMVIRLTDASGTVVYWTSDPVDVQVNKGLFRYPLGTPNQGMFQAIDWSAVSPYVELTVGGTLLLPREPLVSVPYALHARTLAAGAPIDMQGGRILGVGAPDQAADAATKGYVDGLTGGVASVRLQDTPSGPAQGGHLSITGTGAMGQLSVSGQALVGSVGIGTGSPGALLDVGGDARISGPLLLTDVQQVRFGGPGAGLVGDAVHVGVRTGSVA